MIARFIFVLAVCVIVLALLIAPMALMPDGRGLLGTVAVLLFINWIWADEEKKRGY